MKQQIKARLLKERQAILACLNPCEQPLLGQSVVEQWYAVQMQDRLVRIEAALVRLEKGEYGLCRICRQPIHPDRLESLPEAELCLGCQSKLEHKHSEACRSSYPLAG